MKMRTSLLILFQSLKDFLKNTSRTCRAKACIVTERIDTLPQNFVSWEAMEQAQDRLQGSLNGPGAELVRRGVLFLQILDETKQNAVSRPRGERVGSATIQPSVGICQYTGVVVSGTPYHDPNQIRWCIGKDTLDLLERLHATIERELQLWKLVAEPVHSVIHQRRDFPVLVRCQTIQEALSGMDDEVLDAGLGHCANKGGGELRRIEIVGSKPAFHRGRQVRGRQDAAHALPNKLRLQHQRRSEFTMACNAIRRAAAVQIDFVISPRRHHLSGSSQIVWIAPTKLTDNRVLVGPERQEPINTL
mmetsp:Transcript_86224/g.180402  ORF Transcript_86224/g.180402 Transcript_86224/m.180402 type:complete len:304 (-) Transcript_86224:104-1015(-)